MIQYCGGCFNAIDCSTGDGVGSIEIGVGSDDGGGGVGIGGCRRRYQRIYIWILHGLDNNMNKFGTITKICRQIQSTITATLTTRFLN